MFVKSFDLLIQSLKDFSLVSGLKPICAQLYYYVSSNGVTLWNLVQALEDESLREELSPLLEKFLEVKHPEGVAVPDAASVGPMLLQVDPEEHMVAQRKIARPEFAFENGGIFSLDNPEGVLQNGFDMEEFVYEELRNQQIQAKPKRVEQKQEVQTDIFTELQVQKVEEVVEGGIFSQNEPQAHIKSVFMIDKSKLAKTTGQVQINKYTSNLKFGGLSLNKKPVENQEQPVEQQFAAPQQQEEPQQEGRRRRRKHRTEDEVQENQEVEQEQVEQVQEEQVQEPQQGGDNDLASLFG